MPDEGIRVPTAAAVTKAIRTLNDANLVRWEYPGGGQNDAAKATLTFLPAVPKHRDILTVLTKEGEAGYTVTSRDLFYEPKRPVGGEEQSFLRGRLGYSNLPENGRTVRPAS